MSRRWQQDLRSSAPQSAPDPCLLLVNPTTYGRLWRLPVLGRVVKSTTEVKLNPLQPSTHQEVRGVHRSELMPTSPERRLRAWVGNLQVASLAGVQSQAKGKLVSSLSPFSDPILVNLWNLPSFLLDGDIKEIVRLPSWNHLSSTFIVHCCTRHFCV